MFMSEMVSAVFVDYWDTERNHTAQVRPRPLPPSESGKLTKIATRWNATSLRISQVSPHSITQ